MRNNMNIEAVTEEEIRAYEAKMMNLELDADEMEAAERFLQKADPDLIEDVNARAQKLNMASNAWAGAICGQRLSDEEKQLAGWFGGEIRRYREA